MTQVGERVRVGVLVSGRGSNLQALLDAAARPGYPGAVLGGVSDRDGAPARGPNLQALLDAAARPGYPAEVVVVISDRERAAALDRARAVGVEALFVNPKDFGDREAFDLALVRELTARRVGLVCNAGFMRILSQASTRPFAGPAKHL